MDLGKWEQWHFGEGFDRSLEHCKRSWVRSCSMLTSLDCGQDIIFPCKRALYFAPLSIAGVINIMDIPAYLDVPHEGPHWLMGLPWVNNTKLSIVNHCSLLGLNYGYHYNELWPKKRVEHVIIVIKIKCYHHRWVTLFSWKWITLIHVCVDFIIISRDIEPYSYNTNVPNREKFPFQTPFCFDISLIR